MAGLISAISKYSNYLLLLALAGALTFGGAMQLTNDRLEVEVAMYKAKADNAQTIDEMNKSTAIANQLLLQGAIDKQNKLFTDLALLSTNNSKAIMQRIQESQVNQTAQYTKVISNINSLQIDSCQGLMDALIKFPTSGATSWGKSPSAK